MGRRSSRTARPRDDRTAPPRLSSFPLEVLLLALAFSRSSVASSSSSSSSDDGRRHKKAPTITHSVAAVEVSASSDDRRRHQKEPTIAHGVAASKDAAETETEVTSMSSHDDDERHRKEPAGGASYGGAPQLAPPTLRPVDVEYAYVLTTSKYVDLLALERMAEGIEVAVSGTMAEWLDLPGGSRTDSKDDGDGGDGAAAAAVAAKSDKAGPFGAGQGGGAAEAGRMRRHQYPPTLSPGKRRRRAISADGTASFRRRRLAGRRRMQMQGGASFDGMEPEQHQPAVVDFSPEPPDRIAKDRGTGEFIACRRFPPGQPTVRCTSTVVGGLTLYLSGLNNNAASTGIIAEESASNDVQWEVLRLISSEMEAGLYLRVDDRITDLRLLLPPSPAPSPAPTVSAAPSASLAPSTGFAESAGNPGGQHVFEKEGEKMTQDDGRRGGGTDGMAAATSGVGVRSSPKDTDGGAMAGAIAGSVAGILLLALCCLSYFGARSRHRKRREAENTERIAWDEFSV